MTNTIKEIKDMIKFHKSLIEHYRKSGNKDAMSENIEKMHNWYAKLNNVIG